MKKTGYGSKADNLKVMKEAGVPVPDFYVIPFSECVSDVSEIHRVIDEVSGLPVKKQSAVLREAAERSLSGFVTVPASGGKWAVRSSSSAEDSASHSFAGQFDTYLNTLPGDVPDRVADCVCSLFNENVIDYMNRNDLSLHDLEMNVIVQKMVESDISGILFTANPKGILNESVIIAGRGLGENVVGDKTDTTAYYYNTTDDVYYFDDKEDLLSPDTVKKLIDLSKRICELFGDFLDIEFAIEKGKIYILQARPITTVSADHPLIFDNSNIVESYPGLSLPLTASFVTDVYAGVFNSAARIILKNKKAVESLQDVLSDTVGCANGRMYYKISNWYKIINCLPFHKVFLPIWQELVGVKYKDAFTGKAPVSPLLRAKVCFNTVSGVIRSPRSMEKLHKLFDEINGCVKEQFKREMTPKEIFELYDLIEERILSKWGLTLINDTYAFLFTGLVKKRMKKKGSEEEANALLSGLADMESLKPVRAMLKLAKDRPGLSESEYLRRRENYIDEFGDRSPEELKLETLTYRTSPELLDEKILEYSMDPDKLVKISAGIPSAGAEAVKNTDLVTRFLIRKATEGICHREKSRLNRGRIFGLVREAMLRLGDIYADQGLIDEKRDVFYLTLPELRQLADKPENMSEKVEERKKQYEMFAHLPAYSRLIFSGREFDKMHASINRVSLAGNRDEMVGVACSDGVIQGEAYVVEDISKVKNVKDKILVTKMTDPGWVFLIAAAKGVISEKGSLLSHTAIISRELGIPAVVGISDVTETIKSGDLVQLDGTRGTVKILRKAS